MVGIFRYSFVSGDRNLATRSDGIKPGIEIEKKKIQPSIIFPKA